MLEQALTLKSLFISNIYDLISHFFGFKSESSYYAISQVRFTSPSTTAVFLFIVLFHTHASAPTSFSFQSVEITKWTL